MKICFYDGHLEDLDYDFATRLSASGITGVNQVWVVDAADGPTKNENKLNDILAFGKGVTVVLTNSLVALDTSYAWDTKKSRPDIWIWKNKKSKFINIQDLTDRQLFIAHNIEKLYRNGEFQD